MILRTTFQISLSIVLWFVVISTIIMPLLPIWILIITTKLLEEVLYETFYRAQRFKSEEIAWMYDDPKNRTIINSVVMMDGKVDIHKFRKSIEDRLRNAINENGNKRYSRATKYVHPGYVNHYWIEERDFKIDDHVFEWSANPIENESELHCIVNELSTRPLIDERNMSPWENILLHYNTLTSTKSVILIRSHHCIADGTSYVYFLVNELNELKMPEKHLPKITGLTKILLYCKGFFHIPISMVGLLLRRTPKLNTLHTDRVSGRKDLAWTKPIRLELIKKIKNKLGVTINDVLVGCLATNLHSCLTKSGKALPKDLTVCLPADTRMSIEEAREFSNKFAVLFFDVPTTSRDPLKNVMEIHHRMDAVKRAGEALSLRYDLQVMGYFLPERLGNFLNSTILKKASMVLSNVRGPEHPIVIAGKTVEFMTFWPPQRGTIGSCVSFFTYNGSVMLACGCDDAVVTNPNEILGNFNEVITALARTIGIDDLYDTD